MPAARIAFGALFATLMCIAGCGDGSPPVGFDAGPPPQCARDIQCSDGVFCNGTERCAPTDEAADVRGCAPANDEPCLDGQTCDEAGQSCITQCAMGADADGDGADSMDCGGLDCDDSDPLRYPGNIEICDPDGRDEDCSATTFGLRDLDGDGAIDAACCNGATCGTDCDDTDGSIRPGAVEACDGLDNDCDGATDEGVDTTFYVDADGDGYGDRDAVGVTLRACRQPVGYSLNNLDCDDAESSVNPAAFDRCDGTVDDDCSGVVDDPDGGCDCTPGATRACPLSGACGQGSQSCVGGFWGPCSVYALPEACDGSDNDCDGVLDTGCACAPGSTVACGTDVGECVSGVRICGGDGAFSNCIAAVGPTAELCNQRDDDCDGTVDEGASEVVWYPDVDGDGVGVTTGAQLACLPPATTGWSPVVGDCSPNDATRVCEDYDESVLSHSDPRALTATETAIFLVGASYGGQLGYRVTPPPSTGAPYTYEQLGTRVILGALDDTSFDSVYVDEMGQAVLAGGTGVYAWDMSLMGTIGATTAGPVRVAYGNLNDDTNLDPIVWTGTTVELWVDDMAGAYTQHPVATGTIEWAGGGIGISDAANVGILYATPGTMTFVRVDEVGTVNVDSSLSIPATVRDCAIVEINPTVLCATDGGVYALDFAQGTTSLVSVTAPVRIRARTTMTTPNPDILVLYETPPRIERWRNARPGTVNPYDRFLVTESVARDAALIDVDSDADLDVVYLTTQELRVAINREGF